MRTIAALLTALAIVATTRATADEPKAQADPFQADSTWKPLGKDAWFDPQGKRLVLRARVALQDGVLEHLLCKKNSKEHESILATEAPARVIHAGLLLAGASPGHPVKFQPTFEAPTGSAVTIEVEWEKAGKLQKGDARDWVKDLGSSKPLARDWVFAGSELFEDPRSKAMIYAADDGDYITVANFPASILDLPYRSSASDSDRGYAADPAKVPPRGTLVTMYFKVKPPAASPELKTEAKPAR